MAAMNPIHRWRSLSLLARFTLTGLSLTIAIALILGWALGRQLEQFALQHEADSAAATVALVLDPFFRPEDFAGLSTERYAEVDQFVRERAAHEHMVRIKIWDRDGRVIYADDPLVVGQRFEVEHELAEALEGEVATEISDLSKQENRAERGHFSRLMEIYVPIRLHGDAVVGAYELYRDLSAVEPRIADMQRSLWSSLALAFGALYLALFNLVRRASRELRRQNEELGRLEARREMDRLKSEFVSIVSHELRTPLASLVGFSELLLSREVGEAERRDWTETMHSEAERLSHLVEELLDVSRIEQGRIDLKRQPLDLKQAIERALAAFQGQSSGHRLEQRLQQPLPRVLADPDKLAQVLLRLYYDKRSNGI